MIQHFIGREQKVSQWAFAALATTMTAAGYLIVRRTRNRRNEPPGPSWFIPFVGETPAFAGNPVEFVWTRYKRYKSSVFASHLFGTKTYVVGDMEAVRGVLASPDNVEGVIPIATFDQIVKLYNTRGDIHKVFRKHMGLALSPGNIKANLPHFTRLIEEHVLAWVSSSSQGSSAGKQARTICLDNKVRNLLLEVAIGPIMGLRVQPDCLTELLELITVVQAGLFAAPIYFPGTTWYRAINNRPRYIAMLKALLALRIPTDPLTHKLRLAEDRGGAPGLDTTRVLMQEFQDVDIAPDEDNVAERLLQNMLGATETSFGLMWATLVVLAARPDVQEGIRREQAALIQSTGQTVTWEALQTGMPYTDACVREAARLVPSAHGVFRTALKDLQVCGYTIPKGSSIIVSLDLLSARDTAAANAARQSDSSASGREEPGGGPAHPQGLSEEELLGLGSSGIPLAMDYNAVQHSYKPERWLGKDKPRHLHLFSHGAHYCLGKDLALMEIKLAVTFLARQCRWEMDPPGAPRLTLVPFARLSSGKPAFLRIMPDPL